MRAILLTHPLADVTPMDPGWRAGSDPVMLLQVMDLTKFRMMPKPPGRVPRPAHGPQQRFKVSRGGMRPWLLRV